MKFSANLGFLWTELPLVDAIRAAKDAGFAAVECHCPYDTPAEEVAAALQETGLPMLGINTVRGAEPGDMGLSAVPGRQTEARAAIDQAADYACAIRAGAIHVMAGISEGPEAHQAFLDALRYARTRVDDDVTILIEPLNRHDAPGYFLKTTDQARAIIEALNLSGIKLMFDCYHVGRTEGDVTTRMKDLLPIIGHIQFASVPDRGAPDHGEIAYEAVFRTVATLGWTRPLGAEYKPGGDTAASLGWMHSFAQTRQSRSD